MSLLTIQSRLFVDSRQPAYASTSCLIGATNAIGEVSVYHAHDLYFGVSINSSNCFFLAVFVPNSRSMVIGAAVFVIGC